MEDRSLLERGVDVLTLSLAPGGLAPHIGNLPEWRSHILERLRRLVEATADPGLVELLRSLMAIPSPEARLIRRAISPACSCLWNSGPPPARCRSSRP